MLEQNILNYRVSIFGSLVTLNANNINNLSVYCIIWNMCCTHAIWIFLLHAIVQLEEVDYVQPPMWD